MIDDITLERGLRARPPADPVYRSRITATAPTTVRPVTRRARHQAPGRSRQILTPTRLIAAVAIVALGAGAFLLSVGQSPLPLPASSPPSPSASPPATEAPSTSASPRATEAPAPSPLPSLALVTETVEPGVERVVSDGIRSIDAPGIGSWGAMSTNLAVGADGSVWVFETNRLFKLGTDLTIKENHAHYYGADPEVAPDGTLWVASFANGYQRLDGSSWVQMRPHNPYGGNALAIQPDGTVWAAWTQGLLAVVARLDGDAWTTLAPLPPSTVPNETVSVLHPNLVVSPAGDVWVVTSTGTNNGEGPLFHFAGGAWETVDPFGAGFASRYRLIADDQSGGLWALGSTNGEPRLGRLSGGVWTVFDESDGVPARSSSQYTSGALAVAPDGTVWLTTQGDPTTQRDLPTTRNGLSKEFDCGGLVAFDGTTWTPYLRNTCIFDLDVGDDSTAWVITPGGLDRIRR